MFRDSSSKDETILKTKKDNIDMINKANNKIDNIEDINKILIKIKDKVSKNIQSIFDKVFIKLPDDPQLRLAYLNKGDAEMDDALNFVWNKFCKNKIRSKKINRDKYKDFDRYIRNKLELLERVEGLLIDIIREIEDKLNMICRDLIYNDKYKMSIDKLHLINNKLDQIMGQPKKGLRNIISLKDIQ